MSLKSAVVRSLEPFGVAMTSTKHLERVTSEKQALKFRADRYAAYLELIAAVPGSAAQKLASVAHQPQTQSQLGQDLFALLENNFKRGGYFVEFGAADGVFLSNTHLLEMGYGWHGILAEPAISWHGRLKQARTSKIDHRCVWSKSGETLQFNETSDAEYSTVASLNDNDQHSLRRTKGKTYEVPTVSLNDLLQDHDAPSSPDYLSIDTEGSELDILSELDFDRYRFKVITCEHNHTPQGEKIFDLLTSKGYVRKLEDVSKWDDWYVLA